MKQMKLPSQVESFQKIRKPVLPSRILRPKKGGGYHRPKNGRIEWKSSNDSVQPAEHFTGAFKSES